MTEVSWAASATTRPSGNRGLVLVVSGDNLRKSAALNAVQVAGLWLATALIL